MTRRTRTSVAVAIGFAAALAAQAAKPAGLDPGDSALFAARPLEARWLLYRADLDAHPAEKNRKAYWVAWLGARRDFELLEMIAIYEGWALAGKELHIQGAPQWLRVAVWNLASADSHDLGAVQKLLADEAPLVLGWFARYPAARRGKLAEALLAQLEATAEPGDPGDQLPPLDDAATLFAYLDVPRELATATPEEPGKPGSRSLHQVVRALHGLRARSEHVGPHLGKVIRLLEHPHGTVRGEAANALTRLPGNMLPPEPLLALTKPPHGDSTRNLATFALAYATHPAAFFALHDVAADAAHPGRAAALSRLAEWADRITAQWANASDITVPGLAENLTARAKSTEAHRQQALQLTFERAGWAAATEHPAAELAARALAEAARHLGGNAVAQLKVDPSAFYWQPGERSLAVRLALVKLRESLQQSGK